MIRGGTSLPERRWETGDQVWRLQRSTRPGLPMLRPLSSSVFRRTSAKYGGRGERYVHIEAGHAAENVCLQAVALGLGTTVVGAFSDAEVKRLLGLGEEEPLLLIPVGKPG